MHRAEEEKITPQELIAELPKGLVKMVSVQGRISVRFISPGIRNLTRRWKKPCGRVA